MNFDGDGNPTREFVDSDRPADLEVRVVDEEIDLFGIDQSTRKCRECGWSNQDALVTHPETGERCRWQSWDLCTFCASGYRVRRGGERVVLKGADGKPLIAA